MAQAVEHILGKDEVTSSSLVSSSTKKHDIGRVFLMCAKNFAHICTISLKLCVEPVVCARRLRILRALIAFTCQQQLYGLFCHRSLSAALDAFSCKQSLIFACRLKYPAKLHAATACRFLCAFRTPLQKLCWRVRFRRKRCLFWFFQLEDIVDFPLIHRPYGFIVQFFMINTGNGGSFVQL